MPDLDQRSQRVMVIGAHPDDPEFGCAGAVAKWANEDKRVTYLLLTSGDQGSRDTGVRPGEMAQQREEEQQQAARELGVAEVIFLHRPDGLLENDLALRREISWHIRQQQPDIVVTIDPWRHYQLHPDHRAAGQAALDAIYAAREWNIFPEQIRSDRGPWRVKDVLLFWTDVPDHWEDISSGVDKWAAALARHTSQIGDRTEKLADRIREGAASVGKEHGLDFAQAFKHFKF